MENTSAQERIRQFLFRIGGNDHDGTVLCFDCPLCFMDIKLHLIQLPQQIVRELQIRLVNLIDQQHYLFIAFKRFPQFSELDIACDIVHAFHAKLSVVQTLYRIIHIQTILRLGRGFDIPDDQFLAK